ncbi:MAG: hypothetical protein R3A48_14600 [Polyangiales bacterium]
MRVLALIGSLTVASLNARAESPPRPDRFARAFSVGASLGVGGPRGVAGTFIELRPWRALAVSVGAGLGGAFGPGFDATITLTPVGTAGWVLGASTSLSRQIMWTTSYAGLQAPSGRSLPGHSDWASLAVVNELRPSSSMMIRVSVGRSWMLNTSGFNLVPAQQLALVDAVDPGLPGVTPLDAVRSAARGEGLGVWFVQVDIAPSWRW